MDLLLKLKGCQNKEELEKIERMLLEKINKLNEYEKIDSTKIVFRNYEKKINFLESLVSKLHQKQILTQKTMELLNNEYLDNQKKYFKWLRKQLTTFLEYKTEYSDDMKYIVSIIVELEDNRVIDIRKKFCELLENYKQNDIVDIVKILFTDTSYFKVNIVSESYKTILETLKTK